MSSQNPNYQATIERLTRENGDRIAELKKRLEALQGDLGLRLTQLEKTEQERDSLKAALEKERAEVEGFKQQLAKEVSNNKPYSPLCRCGHSIKEHGPACAHELCSCLFFTQSEHPADKIP